jgi:hypothetical protein
MLQDWELRVFGTNENEPAPDALLQHVHSCGIEVKGNFRGDDKGWFSAEIEYFTGAPPLAIERYLTGEDNIRSELNRWAAWFESLEHEEHPQAARLTEHLARTTQVFLLRQPVQLSSLVSVSAVCRDVCQFLAQTTQGIYQLDGQGIFDADGTNLVDWDD